MLSYPSDPPRNLASVLVIAFDPNVESFVGGLVDVAGYRTLQDVTVGAGGESLRRLRPDVTLLDTSLAADVVHACLAAANEVGSRSVLMSNTMPKADLVVRAQSEGCLYFSLPGEPDVLSRILKRAVDEGDRNRSALTSSWLYAAA